jgi:hypothetical protein
VIGATIGSTISYGTNFTSGCVAVAGGEVVNGVEDMGNTEFNNLTIGKIDSKGIANEVKFWNNNTVRLFQGRYTCTLILNCHHRCGP